MKVLSTEARPHEKVAYAVTGNSGEQYTVSQIKETGLWYCTCPAFKFAVRWDGVLKADKQSFTNRKPCKHILECKGLDDLHNLCVKEKVIIRVYDSNGQTSYNKYLTVAQQDDLHNFIVDLKD